MSVNHLYPLFVLVAAATVASPGPGVVLTLTNALRYRALDTLGGILGLVFGAFVVATVSATGLGVLLATSAAAFAVMKVVGAAYLVFLGVRLWRAPAPRWQDEAAGEGGFARRFVEGLMVQLTNPKAIFFFLSIFPQFIEPGDGYVAQFATLVVTYATLIAAIHSLYAATASRTRAWLSSERGARVVQRMGGATFVCFGVALAAARR